VRCCLQELRVDLRAIKTNKFFLFSPAPQQITSELASEGVPLQYLSFLLEFGEARLYRDEFDAYQVGVFLGRHEPNWVRSQCLEFGWSGDESCYFVKRTERYDEGVYTLTSKGVEKLRNPDFHSWLDEACKSARRYYSQREWSKILRGPRPFSARELEIVEARRKFRIVSFAFDGAEWVIEVYNGSGLTLPYLSIGLRSKDGRCISGMWLDTSRIGPGHTGVIRRGPVPIYGFRDEDFVYFEKPDPGPEDRHRYWEFKRRRD
jgi:hypothetical protein